MTVPATGTFGRFFVVPSSTARPGVTGPPTAATVAAVPRNAAPARTRKTPSTSPFSSYTHPSGTYAYGATAGVVSANVTNWPHGLGMFGMLELPCSQPWHQKTVYD